MIKNLKLHTKLGVGFGLLVLIAVVLGVLAIISMSRVNTVATDMVETKVPAVTIANLVERSSLLTMYEIRGYSLSEEDGFLIKGREHLKVVNEALDQTFELAKRHDLVGLRANVESARGHVEAYTELLKQTEAKIVAMRAEGSKMNDSAQAFMNTCNGYLAAMDARLKTLTAAQAGGTIDGKSVDDLAWKMNICNDVLNVGNAMRLANWKSQATRSPKIITDGLTEFKILDAKLDELKAKTTDEVQLKQLETCRIAGHAYASAVTEFLKNWISVQELSAKRGEAGDSILAEAQRMAKEALDATNSGAKDSVSALSNASSMLIIGLIIAAAVGIALAVIITRGITGPVQAICATLGSVAGGDLTARSAVAQKDEIGEMAGSLNATVQGLRGMIGNINQNAQGIAGAAEELSAVSKQLTGNAETSSAQSSQAAAAASQISASISSFASGVEEMGVTVNEISKSAGQAASVAQEGVAAAADANTAMTRLGTSSTEIGDIVKVITSIAEQTNLLALNATIEAARAGDAGRGFAVVASEVKDLARKTTEATGDISKRVAGIQGDSKAAQAALARITEIVGKINDLQQTIATAVEEQSATNKELSGNIGQVAQAGTEIAKNVNSVAGAAKEAAMGAGETMKAANELAKLAAELRQAVARFRT